MKSIGLPRNLTIDMQMKTGRPLEMLFQEAAQKLDAILTKKTSVIMTDVF